jgi:hypothetical protein
VLKAWIPTGGPIGRCLDYDGKSSMDQSIDKGIALKYPMDIYNQSIDELIAKWAIRRWYLASGP